MAPPSLGSHLSTEQKGLVGEMLDRIGSGKLVSVHDGLAEETVASIFVALRASVTKIIRIRGFAIE